MNVVDSSGWLEYFADGPNAAFFAAAIEKPVELVVPTISLYEVFKRVLQQRDHGAALQVVAVDTIQRGNHRRMQRRRLRLTQQGRSRGQCGIDTFAYQPGDTTHALVDQTGDARGRAGERLADRQRASADIAMHGLDHIRDTVHGVDRQTTDTTQVIAVAPRMRRACAGSGLRVHGLPFDFGFLYLHSVGSGAIARRELANASRLGCNRGALRRRRTRKRTRTVHASFIP